MARTLKQFMTESLPGDYRGRMGLQPRSENMEQGTIVHVDVDHDSMAKHGIEQPERGEKYGPRKIIDHKGHKLSVYHREGISDKKSIISVRGYGSKKVPTSILHDFATKLNPAHDHAK